MQPPATTTAALPRLPRRQRLRYVSAAVCACVYTSSQVPADPKVPLSMLL